MSERTVELRGLPEWLIRKYLVELGAEDTLTQSDGIASMVADSWRVEWTKRRAALPGFGGQGLTAFAMRFEGPEEVMGPLFDTFMKKAQRGGG